MSKNTFNVDPALLTTEIYHTFSPEYSLEWYNAYESSAYFNIARDKDDNLLPHCLLVSIMPGVISDMFCVWAQSQWMLTVCVFKNDKDLKKFIKEAHGCVVSAMSGSGIELIKN